MDRVTRNHLAEFKQAQGLSEDLEESTVFELFASFCVVSETYDEEFDVHDVHVGGTKDLGLDGVALIVNGALVTSVEEVEDLLNVNHSLDCQFLFVQAKTSSNFATTEVTALGEGILEFLDEDLEAPVNGDVENYREIVQFIYENSGSFRRDKPLCVGYYVTTGQWTDDDALVARLRKWETKIKDTGLLGSVRLIPMGADEVHRSYQRSKNSVRSEFTFANKVLLPDIDGVSEAYVGTVPAGEFLGLIQDGAGNVRKSLFYDNIRDFQDYNAVNQEIAETLRNPQAQGRFAVLNNGITVVAREMTSTGNRFALSDYQIVNGCQTSHVLFDCREDLDDSVVVPLKVIATGDEEVINSIITATNRQTQVTAEDLYALASFQKRLEAHFDAYPDKKKLYYERRSKQYSAVAGIEKVRIISKPVQIRTYAAMWLDDAHRASRYYSALRAQVGDRIFNEAHKLEPYYVAAFAAYKLEFFFRNGSLPVYYKPARYHILMAPRHLLGGSDLPAPTANKVQRFANRIAEVLWNDDKALEAFHECLEVVDSAVNGSDLTRDSVKTQAFTDAVLAALPEE